MLEAVRRAVEMAIDESALDALERRRRERGQAVPRVGVFLFDCTDPDLLKRTIARIPVGVEPWIERVVVVHESPEPPVESPRKLAPERSLAVSFYRAPRSAGYGGTRKAALELSLRLGLDRVVLMRGDGRHPPEAIPSLLTEGLDEQSGVMMAARSTGGVSGLRAEGSKARRLVHALVAAFMNRILGLRLRDYHTGFRLYATEALRRVPFQLNANDAAFDLHLLIQMRGVGAAIREVGVLPTWREFSSALEGVRYAVRGCGTAVDYRLHQLHVVRRGRYFVDQDIRYRFKSSPTSSHMQIISAIRPGSRVLDLGCSRGLFAARLRAKGVRVTGVDLGPPGEILGEIEKYFERDLEQPLELPVGRTFDYVVLSDVIEHLRNRAQLLKHARSYLKEGGRLIVSTGNIALWFYRLSLLIGRFEYGPRGILDETHVHLYTRAAFRREVERAGFRIVRERVSGLPFELIFESTGRSRLVRALDLSYHALARLWPALFAYQNILEAEIATFDEDAIVS